MHESPSSQELLAAVITFLNETAAPKLTGQAAFHARVAANALSLVSRELEAGSRLRNDEIEMYQDLLRAHCDVADISANDLEGEICQRIRGGELNVSTPEILKTLRAVTVNQLHIDQPNYGGLAP